MILTKEMTQTMQFERRFLRMTMLHNLQKYMRFYVQKINRFTFQLCFLRKNRKYRRKLLTLGKKEDIYSSSATFEKYSLKSFLSEINFNRT